jgi:hypothetical protein
MVAKQKLKIYRTFMRPRGLEPPPGKSRTRPSTLSGV